MVRFRASLRETMRQQAFWHRERNVERRGVRGVPLLGVSTRWSCHPCSYASRPVRESKRTVGPRRRRAHLPRQMHVTSSERVSKLRCFETDSRRVVPRFEKPNVRRWVPLGKSSSRFVRGGLVARISGMTLLGKFRQIQRTSRTTIRSR